MHSVKEPLLSIAPMVDWTYDHFRVLMRHAAPYALLYTEMITTGAVLNHSRNILSFQPQEGPLALQLGGSDPKALAQCTAKAEQAGYLEVNLNLGCPSDKVQSGRFGACLMKEAAHAFSCLEAMKKSVNILVTAKTRIGVDKEDSYPFFKNFAQGLVDAGCDKLIIHARKAWLNGLNPKQNRTIPPLHYEYVYQLKEELPRIPVIINGNITTYSEIKEHLNHVDGVMLGRLVCDNPYAITGIHHALFPQSTPRTRQELFEFYVDYLTKKWAEGASKGRLLKPIFNLAHGLPNARLWKKTLNSILQSQNINLLDELLSYPLNDG